MHRVKCIEKIRDENSHIIGYAIISNNKKSIVKPDKLKESIRSGQIEVTNIALTSDNRLIDKKIDTPSKPNITVENLLNSVKTLGYTLNTFDTDCGHQCYIASSIGHLKHKFIIPDDVKYIYAKDVKDLDLYNSKLFKYMSSIKGTLKVVGGKSLISTECMFRGCRAHLIDLSSFDTSKVTNMKSMFAACEAQSIDLRSFNTSNVTTMEEMFRGCEAQSLYLRSFDTSKVTNMASMFHDCKAQSLDLGSFDTSNVTNMQCMFSECKAQSIYLTLFDTSKVTDMSYMFCYCTAQIYVNDPKLEDQLQKDRS